MLFVPPACTATWPDGRPLRILVPLDGSARAEDALGPIREFAATLGTKLLLV